MLKERCVCATISIDRVTKVKVIVTIVTHIVMEMKIVLIVRCTKTEQLLDKILNYKKLNFYLIIKGYNEN